MVNAYFADRLKGGVIQPTAVATTYTATTDDQLLLVSATCTVTLPPAADAENKVITIMRTYAPATAATDNTNVTVEGDGSETIGGLTNYLLTRQHDYVTVMSDGDEWHIIGPIPQFTPRLLSRLTVDLTVDATVVMVAIPAGRTLKVTDVIIEGGTTASGGTSTVLKLGDTSAYSLLNGSTGHDIISATAASLIATGKRIRPDDLYPIADADAGKGTSAVIKSFTGAKNIAANTSGTNVTAGTVIAEVYGFFV